MIEVSRCLASVNAHLVIRVVSTASKAVMHLMCCS